MYVCSHVQPQEKGDSANEQTREKSGTELDSLASLAKQQTLNWPLSIIDNSNYPQHSAIFRQLQRREEKNVCYKLLDRLRSFFSHAVRIFNILPHPICRTCIASQSATPAKHLLISAAT